MTLRQAQDALRLPRAEVGPALLALVEDQWFDRKSARERRQGLANSLVSFGNAEGGLVVIGLHGGKVEGTDADARHRNELMQVSADLTEPPVRARSRLVACIDADGAEDHLLVLEIEPGEVVHVTNRDECFMRIGDEDRKLGFAQRQELVFDRGQSQFDGTANGEPGEIPLDHVLLAQYGEAVGAQRDTDVLRARNLLTRRGELTAAAVLLFGEAPQQEFPDALVRVLRYRGSERGTGSRQQLVEDVRVEGPIPRILEEASSEIERVQPARTALGAAGRFRRESLIPTGAWLEGLVNAVVHRSYSLGGDHIRVEVFDDRIEIESPGRFPGVVRLDDPRGVPRFARNPRIARVCADLRFGQELGEGIRRIYDEMHLAGLDDPLYRQTAASVRLSLSSTPLPPDVGARLPSRSREVMELIREAGGLSSGEVAAALGTSRPPALRRLQALRDAGLIEWVGKSPRDPRAYWRLARD